MVIQKGDTKQVINHSNHRKLHFFCPVQSTGKGLVKLIQHFIQHVG